MAGPAVAVVSQLTVQLATAAARGGAAESIVGVPVVVYPQLNETALDSLVMEKMLVLVQYMGVVLPIVEEEVQTSLWAARCLQAMRG
ncbi:unnamed protein product [Lampetra planeri]